MNYYSEEDVRRLNDERAMIVQKYNALLLSYVERPYLTVRGREFATHGFLRRLGTLRQCIDRVFICLPPDGVSIPTVNERDDATIALQAFVFNAFGCIDNLVWIWVFEKGIRRADGSPLALSEIGFGAKYRQVRASFSEAFRAYLETRKDWFAHLENLRHSLAHRIPLYIPPHAVSPDNQTTYLDLEKQIREASLSGNEELERRLRDEQSALMFFRPWMVHSFEEHAPIIVVHPQMLADFNTVEEIAQYMLTALDQT